MMIIATTPSGYLIEASAYEIANAGGYTHASEVPGWKQTDTYNRTAGVFPVGLIIKPDVTFAYLQKLRQHERRVGECRNMLVALAEMLGASIPATMIPPEPEPDGAPAVTE